MICLSEDAANLLGQIDSADSRECDESVYEEILTKIHERQIVFSGDIGG